MRICGCMTGYWSCKKCECRWRDNGNNTMSLFSSNDISCDVCEFSGDINDFNLRNSNLDSICSNISYKFQKHEKYI